MPCHATYLLIFHFVPTLYIFNSFEFLSQHKSTYPYNTLRIFGLTFHYDWYLQLRRSAVGVPHWMLAALSSGPCLKFFSMEFVNSVYYSGVRGIVPGCTEYSINCVMVMPVAQPKKIAFVIELPRYSNYSSMLDDAVKAGHLNLISDTFFCEPNFLLHYSYLVSDLHIFYVKLYDVNFPWSLYFPLRWAVEFPPWMRWFLLWFWTLARLVWYRCLIFFSGSGN